MKPCMPFLVAALVLLPLQAQTVDTVRQKTGKVLFVYDTLDDQSRFFIEAFRVALTEMATPFDEVAVASNAAFDASAYGVLIVYSRVMAFNFSSPVRSWLTSKKNLAGTNVLLFVTANRWFAKDNLRQLRNIITERNATMIDAVSMATQKMKDGDKIGKVKAHVAKLP